MRVILDGIPVSEQDAVISIFDWGVLRGFGVFEVIRSYDGTPFRLEAHLDRLDRSGRIMAIDLPARPELESWVRAAAAVGDGQVRVIVTGGGRDELFAAPSRCLVLWEPLPAVPSPLSVMPLDAPWHPGTASGPFTGVKWVSYAPNMASSDIARREGFDDALLVSRDGFVLEGPTFCVAWVIDGVVETPTLDLGILASITRSVLFEAAARIDVDVREVSEPLERVLGADEVLALSTVKEVAPIGQIGDRAIPAGPLAGRLLEEFRAIVSAEIARP